MAAPPSNTARISILGTANTGAEIWDTSFWVNDVIVASNTDANAVMAQVGGLFNTNLKTALLALQANDCAVTQLKGYFYAGGSSTASWVGSFATAGAGATTAQLPLQTCMVMTLRTANSGRSYRGRMYLPATGGIMASSAHQFGTSTTTAISTALANFFNAINTSSISGSVCVWSPTRGVMTDVTQITCDQRPDIQRRRANKQSGGTSVSNSVTPRP